MKPRGEGWTPFSVGKRAGAQGEGNVHVRNYLMHDPQSIASQKKKERGESM